MRRFRRIYPPFWASLILVAVVSGLLSAVGQPDLLRWDSITSPHLLRPFEWVTNLTLTHTWLPGLAHTGVRTVNGVSWSWCYEEQFYLLCGLAAAIAAAYRKPAGFFMLLGLTTLAILAFVVFTSGAEVIRGTFLGPKWLQFALGGLVYYRLAVATGWRTVAADATLAGSLVVLTLTLLTVAPSLQWQNPFAQLWVAVTFACVLTMARRFDDAITTTLGKLRLSKPLQRLGSMTYSLYLVHAPIVMIVTGVAVNSGAQQLELWLGVVVPAAIAASVGVAMLFYAVVERRCLNPQASRVQDVVAEPTGALLTSV